MLIKMQGKLGQGDNPNQTEIIKLLLADKRTKLCIVADQYGTFASQDDTAVPLDYPHQVVNFAKYLNYNSPEFLSNSEKYLNKFVRYLFSLEGLVVLDVLNSGILSEFLIPKLEKYYLEEMTVNKKNTVHYILLDKAV